MNFYEQIALNKRKTFLLFLVFFFLAIAIGLALDYITGFGFIMPFVAIFAFIYAFISYKFGDKIVLAVSRAKPAVGKEFRVLHDIVEELCIAAGLPKPKVYYMPEEAINAFATGTNPNNASICVTLGALKKLNREELAGVVAHELSHIKNYDIRTMMIAAVLVGFTVWISDILLRSMWFSSSREDKNSLLIVLGIVLALSAPIVAQLIKLAISRSREFLADATAVQITRYPDGLANALEKIKLEAIPMRSASNATAHLFIANPFKGKGQFLANLFSTHPPIDERIKRLREM
ncbi:MAG: M48 family metallopeptidase [Candidatus Diapherotrites archaeon]|nr:M48 family metallopeptidase [Candidatus Diapherotrites archaeon]